MNILLPDGFLITHAETLEGLVEWRSVWSDGGNIPLGIAAESDRHAKMLPSFFPAGLLLFSQKGRFAKVPDGRPEHTRMTVQAYTKEHAVYLFSRMLGLPILRPPASEPRSPSAGPTPRAAPPAP